MAFEVISCLNSAIKTAAWRQWCTSAITDSAGRGLCLWMEVFSAQISFESYKKHYFNPFMFPFYTPRKYQKTEAFLMFSGGIKWKHLSEMA